MVQLPIGSFVVLQRGMMIWLPLLPKRAEHHFHFCHQRGPQVQAWTLVRFSLLITDLVILVILRIHQRRNDVAITTFQQRRRLEILMGSIRGHNLCGNTAILKLLMKYVLGTNKITN